MQYVIALDQGTTSSRAIVFDREGGIRGVAQREFRQIFPQPGWVEHDATEIWASQSGVLHEALAMAGAGARDIAAIGITNQRETTVVWERATGRPIANAIVWQDRRTAALCDELRAAGHAPLFARKTGLVLDAYFSGTKVDGFWTTSTARGRAPNAASSRSAPSTRGSSGSSPAAACIAPTRPTRAARCCSTFTRATGTTNCWRCSACRAHCCRRSSRRAACARDASIDGVDIPIAGIAGDQQAALFGQACLAPGMAKNTYGTGCFLLLNTGKRGRDVAQQPVDDRRVAARWRHRLRAGRQRVHRRRGRAVAARRPEDHPHGRRTSTRLRAAFRTTAASIWCRRSRDSARRIGMPMRAARSSA